MRPFKFTRAVQPAEAISSVSANSGARFVAGGTNLVDLMKEGVENPTELVDISRLALTQIRSTSSGLSVGSMARNTVTANHPLVRRDYPLLTKAILAGGCIGTDPQHGDKRRESAAANTMLVFLRYLDAVQQTLTRFRLRGNGRRKPYARNFWLVG